MGRTKGNRSIVVYYIGIQSALLQNWDDNASYENWRHRRPGKHILIYEAIREFHNCGLPGNQNKAAKYMSLAATKQLNEWYFLFVCLSIRLSVCPSVTPFWLCSHYRIIMKFSGVITSLRDQGKVHAKGQGQRSKVKVTEVTTQLKRFRTVTPVWIHIRWWNDTYSLILLRRGALLFLKVIRQISRSHGAKNRQIWPRLDVSGL